MKRFFNLLWFIIFYGGFVCMCLPQCFHKYLGHVEKGSEYTRVVLQYEDFGSVHYLNEYIFKYKDPYGVLRNSSDIKPGEVTLIPPETGFKVKKGSWREKQFLKHGEVYACGWETWYLLLFIAYGCVLLLYFFIHEVDHIDCINSKLNYNCERCGHNFGCPFMFTDIEHPLNFSKLKSFCGYEEISDKA